MTSAIDTDFPDFELPPAGAGAEIADIIDVKALAEAYAANALFTHVANVGAGVDSVVLFNATALATGNGREEIFSLIETDPEITEADLMRQIGESLDSLQAGDIAVLELSHFSLTNPPFGARLPKDEDAMVQWEAGDIADLLAHVTAYVKEVFSY